MKKYIIYISGGMLPVTIYANYHEFSGDKVIFYKNERGWKTSFGCFILSNIAGFAIYEEDE